VAGLVDCSGNGTFTAAYGGYFSVDASDADGTITNAYGVYVADTSPTGTITNHYGVYQASTSQKNIFAGRTTFGAATAPTEGFEVHSGTGRFKVHDATDEPTHPGYTSVIPAECTASSGSSFGLTSIVGANPTVGASGSLAAIYGYATTSVSCAQNFTTTILPNVTGVYAYGHHVGTGTIDKVAGLYSRANCASGSDVVAMLAAMEASVVVGGTATDAVGLLLPAFEVTGTATNQWAIQQTGTEDSWLRGTLLLTPESSAPAIPDAQLHIYRDTADSPAWLAIENNNNSDSYIELSLTLAKAWTLGVDNSDSDQFKICESSSFGTNARLSINGDAVRIDDHLGVDADASQDVAILAGGSCGAVAITDGITEPPIVADMAVLYVDTSTGNLCVKFSNGTVVPLASPS
jgi:hypothetical protein